MAMFDDIQKANKELERLKKDYFDLTGKTAPLFKVNNIKDANAAVETMNKSLAQTRREIEELDRGFGGIAEEIGNILTELGKANTPIKESTKQLGIQEKIARKLRDDQAGINKLSLKELEALKSKQASSQDIIKSKSDQLLKDAGLENSSKKQIENEIKRLANGTEEEKKKAEILALSQDENNVQNRLGKQIQDRIDKEKVLNDALGISGGLLKGVKGSLDALGLGGLASVLNLEEAQKEMEKVADEVTKGGTEAAGFSGKLKIMSAGSAALGKGLMKAFTDPATVMVALTKGLMDAFKHLDEDTGNIAKNMNMSYTEALKVTGELKSQAKASGDVFVTTAGMTETMLAVNDALGISVQLTGDQAAEFTSLREQAGLTNEELIGINALSATTGKGMKEITGEVMAQARLKGQELGVALNEKEILKEIGKVSAATTLSFGKNPGLIAEAVAATKALGLEMGQVEGIADSLLDFEGGIAKEMEAELLLGKNLNLEKARQAALDNDLVTLAEEIAKNVGDSADFAEMNRIQQDALAASVGMSREELGKMLFNQEQLVGLSAEETAIREKQINDLEAKGLSQAEIKEELANTSIAQLEEQASISDKMNASMDKLKEAFGSIAIIAMPFFNGMASAAAALAEMPVVAGILVGVLGSLAAMAAVLAISSMVQAVGAIFTSFGAIPFGLGVPAAIGTVLALGGLIGGVVAAIPKGDDVVMPGSSGGGYGGRMLKGPEGVISLNNKDTVIAGTNLFPKGDDVMSAPAGAISMGGNSGASDKTNQLLTQMVGFQKKQPGFSRVSLYEVQ